MAADDALPPAVIASPGLAAAASRFISAGWLQAMVTHEKTGITLALWLYSFSDANYEEI